MTKTLFLFAIFFCLTYSLAQTKPTDTIRFDYERFSFEVGLVVPLGNLNQQFDPSLNLGL